MSIRDATHVYVCETDHGIKIGVSVNVGRRSKAFGKGARIIRTWHRPSGDAHADKWFPSSKTCSTCGTIRDALSLSVREWTCECGAHHDRDGNAAINLEQLVVGPARAKPIGHGARSTCGEIGALAGRQLPTKLRSVNRKSAVSP